MIVHPSPLSTNPDQSNTSSGITFPTITPTDFTTEYSFPFETQQNMILVSIFSDPCEYPITILSIEQNSEFEHFSIGSISFSFCFCFSCCFCFRNQQSFERCDFVFCVIFHSNSNLLKYISIDCESYLITENVIETFLMILNSFVSSKKDGKLLCIEIFHLRYFMYFLHESCCLYDIGSYVTLENLKESFMLNELRMIENGIGLKSSMKTKYFDEIFRVNLRI
jgi:hypothetical protein